MPDAAFLPPHLVRDLARPRRRRAPPFVDRLPAALLFSDIAGFTALTEKLQARGREGAEEIAEVIGTAFKPVLRSIRRWEGSLVNFGGDAVFAIFPGASPVRRALAAAQEIRALFDGRPDIETSAGPVRLSISQVIHFGTVSGMHLGQQLRRQYLVAGPAVTALKRLDHQARQGEVILSRAARRQAGRERKPAPDGRGAPAASPEALHPYVPRHVHQIDAHFDGEYRRAAIVFFETKGWSLRFHQRFVEHLHRMLDAYEGILISTDISEHGAVWLCAFGAPVAHEHDLERAAQTALSVVSEAHGLPVRAALHAGEVANIWMGDRHRRSFEMLGDVLNTTARALTRAGWGEVVITDATRRACRGVETVLLGRYRAKGKERPLHLHRLVSARAPVRQVRSAVPLVGRSREMKLLTGALQAAGGGRGAAIAINGEAGLGKSRLKFEATKLARRMGFDVHEGRAVPFGGTPYGPIAQMVRHALGIPEGAGRDAVLSGVKARASRLALGATHRHHVAELLGARFEDSPLRHLDGNAIRLNNKLALGALCRALAAERPCLFVLEDVHWADEESREAARWLARGIANMRALVLVLHRPEMAAGAGVTEIRLSALAGAHVRRMLRGLLGPLPPGLVGLVEQRCEGVPLYIEEVVWHFMETGLLVRSGARWVPIRRPRSDDFPGGIDSLLRARLDRLSPRARRVAQYASVLGRSFSPERLAAFAELSPHLEQALQELHAQELVFPLGPTEHIFKHALIRDAAYATLLARRRRELHRKVATSIEETHHDDATKVQALLGHHWQLAGEPAQARHCYLAAARAASALHAHEESQRLYRAYLELLDRPTAESIAVRGELAESLGFLERLEESYQLLVQGVEESEALGDPKARPGILRSLGAMQRRLGRLEEARRTLLAALARAREVGDRSCEGATLGNLGILLLQQGRVAEAQDPLEQNLAITRELGDRGREAVALASMGELLFRRGLLNESQETYRQSLAVAREVGDLWREGHALGDLGGLAFTRGRLEEALGLFQQAMAIARAVGDRGDEHALMGNVSSLHLMQGRLEEAGAGYEGVLAAAREVGDREAEALTLGNLAILRWRQGRMDEAQQLYERTCAMCHELGQKGSEAAALGELARLHGIEGRMTTARALLDQSLALHRELGSERMAGVILGYMADLELFVTGDVEKASALSAEGAACFTAAEHEIERAELLCGRGHIALAGGTSARDLLAEVRRTADDLSIGAASGLGEAMGRLERAEAAHEAGEPLVCGYSPVDLTEAQLRWVRENRPEPCRDR